MIAIKFASGFFFISLKLIERHAAQRMIFRNDKIVIRFADMFIFHCGQFTDGF